MTDDHLRNVIFFIREMAEAQPKIFGHPRDNAFYRAALRAAAARGLELSKPASYLSPSEVAGMIQDEAVTQEELTELMEEAFGPPTEGMFPI